MSFDTARGRAAEYIYSCLKVSNRLPSDKEIYAVTGYMSWRIRLKFFAILSLGLSLSGLGGAAIVLLAKWLGW